MSCVVARGVRKRFRNRVALDGIDLRIDEGHVVGVLGPNGAGKTTLLQGMLGLIPVEGELQVMGLNPWTERATLMRAVSFVTDVASMPRWLRVVHAVDYVAAVQPAFDRAKVNTLLARSGIKPKDRIGTLSKGLVAQLQLALAMGVDARLMVLDEPTLGLDLVARKQFFDALLARFADGNQTLVIATHDVDEIQHILTHIVLLREGRVAFTCAMDEYDTRFVEVHVHPEHLDVARTMEPIHERAALAGRLLIFDGADVDRISLLGELRRPSLSTLCAALLDTREPE